MFNLSHILYIVISLVITIGLLIGFSFIKKQKGKDWVLKGFALATFILHISIMWVDFLQHGGHAEAPGYVLWPIFFCNMCMYIYLIVAFIPNKQGRAFKWLATFVAYGAFFGGMITLFFSDYLANDPNMTQWITVKSLLSHSTMMLGCIYLFVGGYVKIRVKNLIPFCCGLVGALLIGVFLNWLFPACGIPSPNSMYLQQPALDGTPFYGYVMAPIMVVSIFIFTVIWEQFAVKKGERWYNKFKKRKPVSLS